MKIMSNKVTQKELFGRIAEMAEGVDNEIVEFAQRKIAQLEKRAAAPRKPRFNKESNAFAWEVYGVLADVAEPMTNKEIAETMTEKTGDKVSSQKVAAAIRKIADGKLMEVAEDGSPIAPAGVELVVNEGEKKSDPRTFAVANN